VGVVLIVGLRDSITGPLGVVLIIVGTFAAITFQFPRDWEAGWPPPWIKEMKRFVSGDDDQ
jgi:hypothetical protein